MLDRMTAVDAAFAFAAFSFAVLASGLMWATMYWVTAWAMLLQNKRLNRDGQWVLLLLTGWLTAGAVYLIWSATWTS